MGSSSGKSGVLNFLTLILMLRLTLILTLNQFEPIESRKQTVLVADT
jgi:hypothetical protein